MAKEIKYEIYPVCPMCGHKHFDAWEWNIDEDEYHKQECKKCGEEFEVMREVEVTYSTRTITPVSQRDHGNQSI